MKLGNFSLSLTVKDLVTSKAFYEKLGFEVFGGELAQNWLIMKNDETIIGLFQGMFDKNLLTFNPGWDSGANKLDSFMDVREIHQKLSDEGLDIMNSTISEKSGPASFSVVDPDGNAILFDQHV